MSINYKKNVKRIVWAFIWIVVGVIWILSNYGKLPYTFNLSKDWPIIFIIIGVITLYKIITAYSCRCRKKDREVTSSKDAEEQRKQILDAVENNEMSVEEAAKKLKDI